jgi:hypothetical protein
MMDIQKQIDNNPPDHYSTEQAHRIAHILVNHDIVSRSEFEARFDKGVDYTVLNGIGKVRGPILKWLMQVSPDLWTEITGIDA